MERPEIKEENASVANKSNSLRWYSDPRSIMLIALAVLIPLSIPAWRTLNDTFNWLHPLVISIIAGIVTSLMVLPICYWADTKVGISIAGLLGLLTSIFCVFGAAPTGEVTSPMLIAFFVFHILFAYSESNLLWPQNYQKYVEGLK